jgi:hypothetical protein
MRPGVWRSAASASPQNGIVATPFFHHFFSEHAGVDPTEGQRKSGLDAAILLVSFP